jgi:hypothetical protein
MKPPRRRNLIVAACVFAAAIGSAVVTVGRYDRSPDPPDVNALSLREAMQFEGSDEYGRLSAAKRRAFSEAVIDKLHALPFEEMLRIALDPANLELQRRRLANLRQLPNYDELHSRLAADFLEKFYELPAFKRSVYLTAFAYHQELESRLDPGRFELPGPSEFHADAVKMFAGKSPRMKAHAFQFLIDLRRQRQRLGLRDLPLPMN